MNDEKNLYEGMFLFDSGDFAGDPDGFVESLSSLIERFDGEVEAHRPWQDGRLAYEIRGKRKGLHYIAMFKMPPSRVSEFERAGKLDDKVLRQLIIKHPPELYDAMVAAISPEEEVPEDQETQTADA